MSSVAVDNKLPYAPDPSGCGKGCIISLTVLGGIALTACYFMFRKTPLSVEDLNLQWSSPQASYIKNNNQFNDPLIIHKGGRDFELKGFKFVYKNSVHAPDKRYDVYLIINPCDGSILNTKAHFTYSTKKLDGVIPTVLATAEKSRENSSEFCFVDCEVKE